MAIYHGRGGYVTCGTTSGGADDTVLNVTAWSYEQTAPSSEITSMGDTAKTYKLGFPSGSGTIECYFNPGVSGSDTDGQDILWGVLAGGTAHQVQLFTQTTTAATPTVGDDIWQGDVVVNNVEFSSSLDGMVTFNISFRGVLDQTTYSTT